MTDGVLTARPPGGSAFGRTGVESLLREPDRPIWELPRAIVHRVREHAGTVLPDDASCVVLHLPDANDAVERTDPAGGDGPTVTATLGAVR